MDYKGRRVEKHVIGTRHGEKVFETLVTQEEMARAEDLGSCFRIYADGRDLNYASFFSEGDKKLSALEEYTSNNTQRLQINQVVQLLGKLGYQGEQC